MTLGASIKPALHVRAVAWRFIALLFILCAPGIVASQDPVTSNPTKVKAAFLRNFTRYVTWPADVFSADRPSWKICVLGNDPFGDILDTTLAGRTEQGRSFEIHRADTLNDLPRCQVVYIAYQDAAKRRAALAELRKSPILTVSEASDFLRDGGIIQFQVGERVEMNINLDQSRSASLTISAKMLEVAHEVVENSAVKKWR